MLMWLKVDYAPLQMHFSILFELRMLKQQFPAVWVSAAPFRNTVNCIFLAFTRFIPPEVVDYWCIFYTFPIANKWTEKQNQCCASIFVWVLIMVQYGPVHAPIAVKTANTAVLSRDYMSVCLSLDIYYRHDSIRTVQDRVRKLHRCVVEIRMKAKI